MAKKQLDELVASAVKATKFQLNTLIQPSLSTGELCWNPHDMTANLKVPGATLQINQEQVLPVKNATASTLLNGRLVRINGYDIVDDYYTVVYSDNSTENSAYVDFMLTEDTISGGVGLATKNGIIHDLNTTDGVLSGVVYLGTNGLFTSTKPSYPNKVVVIGFFGSIHSTSGEILVDLNRSNQYSVNTITSELELKLIQNPGIDQSRPILPMDISIDTTNRVLTITTINGGQTISPSNPIRFFTDGNGLITKHEKSTSVSFPPFTDTSGVWYFYFDSNGNPITSQTSWHSFATVTAIYRLYWNATLVGNDRLVVESFECHTNETSASDHAWKHAQGSVYVTGLDITSNFLSTGSPNANGSNTVIGISSGVCSDDGLEWNVINTTTPVNYFEQDLGNTSASLLTSLNSGLFKIRTNNTSGLLSFFPATRFPFKWNTTNNRPQYITTEGVATDVPDNNFMVYYVYNLSDRGVGNALKLVSAASSFSTLTGAQAHSWETLRGQYATIKDNEIRPIYKLIFHYP